MNILVAESNGFCPQAAEMVRSIGDATFADLKGQAFREAVRGCEVLWVRLGNPIDGGLLDSAPDLKWIVSPTTGLNHIDLEAAERHGVRVLSLKGETNFLQHIRATAELALCHILNLLRRVPAATAHVLDGGWDREAFRGHELYQSTVGLVGFGRLGRILSRYLLAMGARVVAYDPFLESSPEEGVELLELNELLKRASMVSLHAAWTPENEGFFNADCFGRMRNGSRFVNTARGELVDEAALLDALREKRLVAAAVDVLADETGGVSTSHPLVAYAREHDHLLITPHLGGCTYESMARTERFMAEKLIAIGGGDMAVEKDP